MRLNQFQGWAECIIQAISYVCARLIILLSLTLASRDKYPERLYT